MPWGSLECLGGVMGMPLACLGSGIGCLEREYWGVMGALWCHGDALDVALRVLGSKIRCYVGDLEVYPRCHEVAFGVSFVAFRVSWVCGLGGVMRMPWGVMGVPWKYLCSGDLGGVLRVPWGVMGCRWPVRKCVSGRRSEDFFKNGKVGEIKRLQKWMFGGK